MSTASELNASNLAQFYGTANWYRHSLCRNVLMTDGAYFVMNNGAGWLIDAIASYVQHDPKLRKGGLRDFQLWELKVNSDRSAVLECRADSDRPAVVTQRFDWTDFPLDAIRFYVEPMDEKSYCILLPSEH